MAAPGTASEIRDVNTRYHDAAADEYDHKWGIDFHDIGRQQVLGKVTKLLGSEPGPFERGLEIGAGTGYFAINLVRAGVIGSAVCTDISPGMLSTLERNAQEAGVGDRVETEACDAEQLPFADESFDLVFGHAVLHHIPDLTRAFSEFNRVLRPGGTLFFAGEPSREGDKIAAYPKRGAMKAAPVWRRLMGAQPAPHVEHPETSRNGGHELEGQVDVHTFVPADLRRYATYGGFEDIRVRGEELLANWFGWANRTLESSAEPGDVPWLWIQYAYRGYLALQEVDRHLLEPRLPPALFYNLMVSATKP